ncbi:MAG: metallophosphatase family protein [Chloroflexota bacterium]|nr:metallophosphatase family protein [Chloroflexota bacterium]
MRIAIIADTHGNLVSTNAVLADIEADGIDQIVCLGDVAGLGPHPREVIRQLRSLGCPVVLGNADEFLLDPSRLDPDHHPDADETLRRMHEMEQWAAEQLAPEDLAYLRTFQPTVELLLDDGATLLCYHGSPRSNWDEIRSTTPDDELAEQLDGRRAAVMAGGHTHEQFVRRLDRAIVVNPGSVGLPWESVEGGRGRNPPWAEYAVVTHDAGRLSIDLRRVSVDLDAVRQALLDSSMPHAAWWAADWY